MDKFNEIEVKQSEKEYAQQNFLRAITEMKEHFTVADIQEILNEEIGSKDKVEF